MDVMASNVTVHLSFRPSVLAASVDVDGFIYTAPGTRKVLSRYWQGVDWLW